MENDKEKAARALMEKLRGLDHIIHHKVWNEAGFGGKPGQVMLLAKLLRNASAGNDGLRVSDLASAFGITAPGVTQMVTVLEDRGYVVRAMDPNDRRAVRVFLTETGRHAIQSAMATVSSIFQGLVEHLGPEKTRQFLDLLSEMADYLEEQLGPKDCAFGAVKD